MIFFGAAD